MRAVPPGSARYWSWLFAAHSAKYPLLGVYALMAEWRAVADPLTDIGVARIKLEWWHDELDRLAAAKPAHPVTRYLAQWITNPSQIVPLQASIDAADAQIAGVPLERAADMPTHADALYGAPLRVAVELAGGDLTGSLVACTAALAVGEYLARAVAEYGKDCRAGRLPFPVDDLLAAGIENEDLATGIPPPRLETYLQTLRRGAAQQFATADAVLAPSERSGQRHLSVLASLGACHVHDCVSPSSVGFGWGDFYRACRAARRAAATR